MSAGETYNYSVADPSIFKKQAKKMGGFWSVADEYSDIRPDTPPALHFMPGDNNELATRNRINEYLRLSNSSVHPITGESPAPQLYFIQKSPNHNYGVETLIIETRAQKRVKLGTLNGKDIYGEERDSNVPDHSYDTFRYYAASHAGFPHEAQRKPPDGSFLARRNQLRALKNSGVYNRYGDFVPRSHLRG